MTDEPNSDELTAFITSTLKAIAAGIDQAQDTKISNAHDKGTSAFGSPREVEFDVAVSAKLSGSTGGKMTVSVFGIGGDIGANGGSERSTINRIRFSVPTTSDVPTTNSIAIGY